MKITILFTLGLAKAQYMDSIFERTDQLRAVEQSCINQVTSKDGYEYFKFDQKQDGVYINGSQIKHWVGPVKREWNSCMKPYYQKLMAAQEELVIEEKDCIQQMSNNESYEGMKFTLENDGVYINGGHIKKWVGPIKREWLDCMAGKRVPAKSVVEVEPEIVYEGDIEDDLIDFTPIPVPEIADEGIDFRDPNGPEFEKTRPDMLI